MAIIPFHILQCFLEAVWLQISNLFGEKFSTCIDIIQKLRFFFWLITALGNIRVLLPQLKALAFYSLENIDYKIWRFKLRLIYRGRRILPFFSKKKYSYGFNQYPYGVDGLTEKSSSRFSTLRNKLYEVFVESPYYFFCKHGSSSLKVFSIVFPIVHMATWAGTTIYMGIKADEATKHQSALSRIAIMPLNSWKYNFAMLTIEIFCAVLGLYQFYRGWRKARHAESQNCRFELFIPQVEQISTNTGHFQSRDQNVNTSVNKISTEQFPKNYPSNTNTSNTDIFETINLEAGNETTYVNDKPHFNIPPVSWRLTFNNSTIPIIKDDFQNGKRVYMFEGEMQSDGLDDFIRTAQADAATTSN